MLLPPRGLTSCDGAGSADGGGATGSDAASFPLPPLPPPPPAPSAVDLAEPIGEKNSAEFAAEAAAALAARLSLEGGIFSSLSLFLRVCLSRRSREKLKSGSFFFFPPPRFLSSFKPPSFFSLERGLCLSAFRCREWSTRFLGTLRGKRAKGGIRKRGCCCGERGGDGETEGGGEGGTRKKRGGFFLFLDDDDGSKTRERTSCLCLSFLCLFVSTPGGPKYNQSERT